MADCPILIGIMKIYLAEPDKFTRKKWAAAHVFRKVGLRKTALLSDFIDIHPLARFFFQLNVKTKTIFII